MEEDLDIGTQKQSDMNYTVRQVKIHKNTVETQAINSVGNTGTKRGRKTDSTQRQDNTYKSSDSEAIRNLERTIRHEKHEGETRDLKQEETYFSK